MRKALSVLGNALIFLAALLGIALLVLRLLGVQFMAVKTGSMLEDYPVGSIVVIYGCEPEQVKTGDVITYLLDEKTKTYVTHRVISIDSDGRCFVTQGDANNTPDESTVPFSSFLGKVVCCVPKLGYPLLWFGNVGKWVLVGAVGAFALIGFVLSALKKKHTKRQGE